MLERINHLAELCDSLIDMSRGPLPGRLDMEGLVCGARRSAGIQRKLIARMSELFSDAFSNPAALTDQEDDAAFALAQRLSSPGAKTDTGLALKIYKSLLERARARGDGRRVLVYLYWCGITLFYNNPDSLDEILAYFSEGASYQAEYTSLPDREMRKYVHRCLEGCVMLLFHAGEGEKARKAMHRTLNFWNDLMFHGIDLDFPWTSYFLSCVRHSHEFCAKKLRERPETLTKDEAKAIFRTSLMLSKLADEGSGSALARGTRYDLILWEAQFAAGLINMSMFAQNVKDAQATHQPGDYSGGALYANIYLPCSLIFYASRMLPPGDSRAIVREHLARMTEYIESIPAGVESEPLGGYIARLARCTSGILPFDEHFSLVVRLATVRHAPAYAHSVIVSKLSGAIAGEYVLRAPADFAGIAGIESEQQALLRRAEIIELAQSCGLCHDVGKMSLLRSRAISARRLAEDEVHFIHNHVKEGLTYFENDPPGERLDAFRQVIEGHHVYFDTSGGYPRDFDISSAKYRTLIHIVAVADSIDAATDDIGKAYSSAISTDEVIRQIRAGAGTRYSPIVAGLLQGNLIGEIDSILRNCRPQAYYDAYKAASAAPAKGGERSAVHP